MNIKQALLNIQSTLKEVTYINPKYNKETTFFKQVEIGGGGEFNPNILPCARIILSGGKVGNNRDTLKLSIHFGFSLTGLTREESTFRGLELLETIKATLNMQVVDLDNTYLQYTDFKTDGDLYKEVKNFLINFDIIELLD